LGATQDSFDVIDLTDNNIQKIDNFPLLKRLDTLLLHNNRIQYIQKDLHEKLPNLKTLALTNNNITELEHIDPLAACRKLEYLTLLSNPLVHKPNYRAYVIHTLKSVRVLDFRRVKDAERLAAKKLFKGKKVTETAGEAEATDPPAERNGFEANDVEMNGDYSAEAASVATNSSVTPMHLDNETLVQ